MSGERQGPSGDVPVLSHRQAEELISDQLDAPLDPQVQRTLAAHLAGCPSCSRFAAQMGVMGEGLHELPRLPASPTVARQVRERLHQPVTFWDRVGRVIAGQMGLAPIAATAALLVAVVAGALLLNGRGESTADNPTVPAATQISINLSLTPDGETDESPSTPPPGRVLETATPPVSTMIRAVSTATETPPPPDTATPTETPVPTATETLVPTATETTAPEQPVTTAPSATATPAAPTETATAVPPTVTAVPPTATEVPAMATEVPATATEVPATATEVPATATVVPVTTPQPTATDLPTETPRASPRPTRTPTELPSTTPTEEPTQTATPEPDPTETPAEDVENGGDSDAEIPIGPLDGAPVDSGPIDGAEEAASAASTETPIEEPTETPAGDLEDGGDGDVEIPLEPADGGSVDSAETPAAGTGGPIDETATEENTGGDDPDDAEPTPTDDGGRGDDDEASSEAVLDNTSRIVALPPDSGAPPSGVRFSPDGVNMVIADAGGQFLRIVDRQSGTVVEELGAGQYPLWSPLGGVLLFHDLSDGARVNAWYSGGSLEISVLDPAPEAASDVPAGWIGGFAYYLRTFEGSGRVELRGYDVVNGGSIGEVWGSDDVELAGARPLQTNSGFLIATTEGWLLVGPDGGVQEVGSNSLGDVGDGLLSPDGSLLAVVAGGGLAIVQAGDPGTVVAELSYEEAAGAGFAWSPDGAYVAISDGSSISFYTSGGDPVGVATSETGLTLAGVQFLDDGVYFVQTSGEASLRRFDFGRVASG